MAEKTEIKTDEMKNEKVGGYPQPSDGLEKPHSYNFIYTRPDFEIPEEQFLEIMKTIAEAFGWNWEEVKE